LLGLCDQICNKLREMSGRQKKTIIDIIPARRYHKQSLILIILDLSNMADVIMVTRQVL